MTSTLQVGPPAGTPSGRRRPRHRRRSPGARWLVAILGAAVVWPSVSYVQALTYPGNASVAVRTVEWARDNGGGGVIDVIENWMYTRPPSDGPPDPASLPTPAVVNVAQSVPPPLQTLPGATPLPGEGIWTAGTTATNGTPAIYTTYERPDPVHPGVVAGVARMDQTLVRTRMIAGTRQPTSTVRPQDAQVPGELQPALVATFNSGFKMQDANGGYFANGRTAVPLRDGAASLVIRRDGTATVAQWGRDATAGPDVVGVRQNLDLIVDNGQALPGLDVNAGGTWGSAKNQLQYTWRSGVGVDAAGNLLYVGGAKMTLRTLADALDRAGAVRAMQLDIHDNMVDLFSYRHDPSGALSATKLLPDMPGSNDRYLVPDQRDFIAVTLR